MSWSESKVIPDLVKSGENVGRFQQYNLMFNDVAFLTTIMRNTYIDQL